MAQRWMKEEDLREQEGCTDISRVLTSTQSFVNVYLVLMCLRKLQENHDFGSQSERDVGGRVEAGFEDR